MTPRGRFIVFEGLDGAGTTTQVARAAEWLLATGARVHTTAEPSRGPIGLQLRLILAGRLVGHAPAGSHQTFDPDAMALLFAADRLDHWATEIAPELEAGTHVLSDRYVLSSLAYQTLETDRELVWEANRKAPPPDLTLLLRVAPETAMKRLAARSARRDSFETLAVQRRVAEAYDRELAAYRGGERAVVDGELGPDEVAATVRQAITALLSQPSRQ
jgi:dTMP kinase